MIRKASLAILTCHLNTPSGGNRYLYEVLKRLAKRYQISLFAESYDNNIKREFELLGINVKRNVRPPKSSYMLSFPFYFVRNLLLLRSKLESNWVVLSVSPPYHAVAAVLSLKTIYLCFEPPVHLYDEAFIVSTRSPFRQIVSHITKTLYSPLDNFGVRKTSVLLAINPSVGAIMSKLYGRTPDLLTGLGVDQNIFSSVGPTLTQIKPRSEFVLSHSTDYTVLKGTEYLLKALPIVLRSYPKTNLYITETTKNPAVKSKYKALMKKLSIQKHVRFLGTLHDRQLASFYRSSDLYCFTGSPLCMGATQASLSVLEAQSCGTPVIRSVGNSDEVVDGETGFFANPLDQADLSNKIIHFLRLPKRRKTAMSRQAIRHVANNYSWDRVSDVFVNAIDRVQSSDVS